MIFKNKKTKKLNHKNNNLMKTKKTQSIIFQILIILSINYLMLISEVFIFKELWRPTFIFALIFFNLGTFISLYVKFTTKPLSKEKGVFIFNLNLFIYLSFSLLYWI